MTRQGAQQSLMWLNPVIQAEPEIIDTLPISCLCELLFASQMESAAPLQFIKHFFLVFFLISFSSRSDLSLFQKKKE
jgi:hypothetical protein